MTLDKITAVVQALGVLVAAVGWPVIYWLDLRRDREAKRRDLRIQYLIDAWRSIEYLVNRQIIDDRFRETIEKALADVQLFGTPNQIQLAQDFARQYSSNGTADIQPLLNDLRNELRRELRLKAARDDIIYLRMDRGDQGARRADPQEP